MDVGTYSANSATTAANDISSRWTLRDASSRIIIAAQEDLGSTVGTGSRAGVYCETGVNMDNASVTGQAETINANTTTLCSRESRLYIGNNLGEVRLGRQNVWWTQGEFNQVGSNMIAKDVFTDLMNGGVGVYTVRGENMVMLNANKDFGAFAGSQVYTGVMGRSGLDQYSTSSTGESSVDHNGKYGGYKLNWAQDRYLAMIDYQTSHNSPTSATGTDLAGSAGDLTAANAAAAFSYKRHSTKYAVGYKYGAPESLVSLQYYKKDRTKMEGGERNSDAGYGITVHHDAGAGYVLLAQYARANKREYGGTTAQTENGATGYTLGAIKRLSKRTHVYTGYNVINNGAAGTYNLSGGNYSSAAVGAGATVKTVAFGLQHWF